MRIVSRLLLISLATLPAGCGAPQPGTLPAAALAAGVQHDASWMAGGLKQHDLLYVSNSNGTVSVYRYWQRTLVGVLTHFSRPLGICADPAGNVYVVDAARSRIDEYAHGGSKPIAVIDDRPFKPWACSVNPKNGAVAVANNPVNSYYKPGNIAVYPPGQPRKVYQGTSNDHFIYCAYDDHGDLLATSLDGYYDYYIAFYYLPKGGNALLPMDLYGQDRYVQGLGYDGKYWVVESYDVLSRYTINLQAKFISDTQLSGGSYTSSSLAIYRRTLKSQATQVVGGAGPSVVEYWKYPAGGSPIGQITKDLDNPYGVAISLKTGT